MRGGCHPRFVEQILCDKITSNVLDEAADQSGFAFVLASVKMWCYVTLPPPASARQKQKRMTSPEMNVADSEGE